MRQTWRMYCNTDISGARCRRFITSRLPRDNGETELIWIYQNEEKLMCPYCGTEQKYLHEDLYGMEDHKIQSHWCEHCGQDFRWSKSGKYSSAIS